MHFIEPVWYPIFKSNPDIICVAYSSAFVQNYTFLHKHTKVKFLTSETTINSIEQLTVLHWYKGDYSFRLFPKMTSETLFPTFS